MPLILPGNVASATASTAYSIANSVYFEYVTNASTSGATMTRTFSTGSLRKWTFSFWVKRDVSDGDHHVLFSNYDSDGYDQNSLNFAPDGSFEIDDPDFQLHTAAYYRDPAAWMHCVVVWDSEQSTDSNRVVLYVNGVKITNWTSGKDTYPDQNEDSSLNTAVVHNISKLDRSSADYSWYNGYLAEFIFIDGTAYDADDFGEFDSDSPTIWKPKDPSGLTFGTNGFWLDFEDSSALGNDVSGNNNDWTPANMAATDQCQDSPTNNFCTMNPLDNYFAAPTFSEGYRKIVTNSSNYSFNTGTIGLSAGLWYFEAKCATSAGSDKNVIGISAVPSDATTNYLGEDAYMWSYYGQAGNSVTGGTSSSYGDSYTTNDIVGVAIDLDNNKLYFAKNNTWQDSGDPTSGATGTGALSITAVASTPTGVYFPAMGDFSSDSSTTWEANFGNPVSANTSDAADANGYGAFEYAPPSGYLAICTKNLGSDGG